MKIKNILTLTIYFLLNISNTYSQTSHFNGPFIDLNTSDDESTICALGYDQVYCWDIYTLNTAIIPHNLLIENPENYRLENINGLDDLHNISTGRGRLGFGFDIVHHENKLKSFKDNIWTESISPNGKKIIRIYEHKETKCIQAENELWCNNIKILENLKTFSVLNQFFDTDMFRGAGICFMYENDYKLYFLNPFSTDKTIKNMEFHYGIALPLPTFIPSDINCHNNHRFRTGVIDTNGNKWELHQFTNIHGDGTTSENYLKTTYVQRGSDFMITRSGDIIGKKEILSKYIKNMRAITNKDGTLCGLNSTGVSCFKFVNGVVKNVTTPDFATLGEGSLSLILRKLSMLTYKEHTLFIQQHLKNIDKKNEAFFLFLIYPYLNQLTSIPTKQIVKHEIGALVEIYAKKYNQENFLQISYHPEETIESLIILSSLLTNLRPHLSLIAKDEVDDSLKALSELLSKETTDFQSLNLLGKKLRAKTAILVELNKLPRLTPFAYWLDNLTAWLERINAN